MPVARERCEKRAGRSGKPGTEPFLDLGTFEKMGQFAHVE
jgi:hypothetical protein